MKIRNKLTGQVFEVVPGALYPSFFEEVSDDEIKVGEPKIEFEIEETKEDVAEETPVVKENLTVEKQKPKKNAKKPAKKGAKKNVETK